MSDRRDGRVAGFDLHLDGVDDGGELTLAIEPQADEASLDAGDKAQSMCLPSQTGASCMGTRVLAGTERGQVQRDGGWAGSRRANEQLTAAVGSRPVGCGSVATAGTGLRKRSIRIGWGGDPFVGRYAGHW